MYVFIDDREQDRIEPAYQFYAEHNLNPIIQELLYGDYVFVDNKIKVAFEYKTIEDYINSLGDNRVFNQAINQSNNYDYHFVIIVGTDKQKTKIIQEKKQYTGKYVTNNEYYGGIASLVNYTSVLQVPRQDIAFDLMLRVAVKCCDTKPVLKRYPKSRGTPALRLLTNNINRVGFKTAERICDKLGLVTVRDVFGLDKERLMRVDGVGDKTADSILKQLGLEFDL